MERAILKRVEMADDGCRGVILFKGKMLACTVELPWRDNERDVSCIPEGVYHTVKHVSPSRGEVFWVKDVPGRTDIQIHVANVPSDLLGCIGVGERFASMNLRGTDEDGVANSTSMLTAMLKFLPDEFELEVVNV